MINAIKRVEYTISTKKVTNPAAKVRLLLITDLHSSLSGEKQKKVLEQIYRWNPDAVLLAGDMIASKEPQKTVYTIEFITELCRYYPVFYENGNHESRWKCKESAMHTFYEDYKQCLQEAGVCFLENQSAELTIRGQKLVIHGLELHLDYYKRTRHNQLDVKVINTLLGKCSQDAYHILLAHSPKFWKAYASWGADLTLCGHYHGGFLRIGKQGVISPYLELFPAYSYGQFDVGKRHMIVSSGAGDHCFSVRIGNSREIVGIQLVPEI